MYCEDSAQKKHTLTDQVRHPRGGGTGQGRGALPDRVAAYSLRRCVGRGVELSRRGNGSHTAHPMPK